jgi:hypothetical protein
VHERWLHARRRVLRDWGEPRLDEALDGVDALEAAGVLDRESAAAWRDRFRRDARGEDAPPPRPAPEQRAAAEGLLEDLLEAGEAGEHRFDGALQVLSMAGAADPDAWDARRRAAYGWESREEELEAERELNAGGTQAELVAVLPGPPERRAGCRVVYALRFADGLTFMIDRDGAEAPDWPQWRLTDDAGTEYWPGGGSGGDGEEEVTVRTAPPADATWVELSLRGTPEATFRIAL